MITKPLPTLIHLSLAPCFLPVIVPALNLASASCQVKGTMGTEQEEDTEEEEEEMEVEEEKEMVERAVTRRPLSGCNPAILLCTSAPSYIFIYR